MANSKFMSSNAAWFTTHQLLKILMKLDLYPSVISLGGQVLPMAKHHAEYKGWYARKIPTNADAP